MAHSHETCVSYAAWHDAMVREQAQTSKLAKLRKSVDHCLTDALAALASDSMPDAEKLAWVERRINQVLDAAR